MALIMLIVIKLHPTACIFRCDCANKRFNALIVVNQISVVRFAVNDTSSGIIIKIYVILGYIILSPYFVMAVRIVQKLSIGFSGIKCTAVK